MARRSNCGSTASGRSSVSPNPLSADVVGNVFVQQYYEILTHSPEIVYRFYQEESKFGRPDPDGVMVSVTTMQAINEKILAMNIKDFRANIKTVDVQESLNGGLIVFVTGGLTRNDMVKDFTQSFFLAPQDKGYYVLNDIFRYKHEDDHQLESDELANELVDQMTLNEHDNLHLNSNSSSTSATLQHSLADEDAALTEAINASIQSAIAEGILTPESQNNSGVSAQGSSSSSSSGRCSNNDSKSCVICLDTPIEGACVPCGHLSGCMRCLNQIKEASGCCPVCRSKIGQVYRIYAVSE